MSVYRRGGYWIYDFWFQKQRYLSPVGLETAEDAKDAEATMRRTIRRRSAGIEALDAADTPFFTDWAGVTFKWQRDRKKIKQPDEAKNTLRMVLAFWGAEPKAHPVTGGMYKNLRLGDPIATPELLTEFEDWMTARKLSGARKNHYRSACSMMYRVALLPEHKRLSGVRENPFRDVLRDRVVRRTAVPEMDDLVRWLQSAPLSVVVGAGIALLSPALRLRNVVDLRRVDITRDLSVLSVAHKTDRETGMPLTIAISPGLRRVLKRVYAQRPNDPYVVPLEGERYWQFVKLVKSSMTAAGLPYGRKTADGITFHSLRHAVSTWMARWKVSSKERQLAMGHRTSAMADWYTHLAGVESDDAMRLIDRKMPVAGVVLKRLGTAVSNGAKTAAKSR